MHPIRSGLSLQWTWDPLRHRGPVTRWARIVELSIHIARALRDGVRIPALIVIAGVDLVVMVPRLLAPASFEFPAYPFAVEAIAVVAAQPLRDRV